MNFYRFSDDTPHIYNDTFLNIEVVKEIIFNLTDVIERYFPDVQCYSALGNHDWSPKSQLPPYSAPLYTELGQRWNMWLKTQDSVDTFKEAGFYKLKVPNSNFTMIVLNTNFYYQSNKLTTGSNWQPDPAGQFSWLDRTLQDIREKGKKAVLLGHVPPGQFEKHREKNWFDEIHNKIFVRLLQKYSNIISAVHMAHHHTDSFRIILSADKAEVVSSILLNSAITPWETTLPGVIGGTGNNPAIRLIKYDRNTGTTLDYHQFYLDLKKANDDNKPNWKSLYNFTDLYKLSSASHEQMATLSKKLRLDGSLFDKYYQMNGVLYDPNETCTGECKSVQLCSIENVDYSDYKNCMGREQP
ncbi:DgyrCDS5129 [Dimorphilus gyrociliatus]|uniref:DgyrCDS5129 n=1 Tax=Dimorphilus gyrociliatus TaxID=2664684 RepID=A0A7I8VIV7_9ANNE|nr:DgyrCDS5129 [Dimorphilus gyrociliatus]